MAERVTLIREGRFAKGGRPGPGRPKGSANSVTRVLRDAIILAAEAVGQDSKGKGGLTGYLTHIAKKHPDLFVGLLGRVLPMQLTGPSDGPVQVSFTRDEAAAYLRERGVMIDGIFDKPVELLAPPKKSNGHATNGHG